ncbi:MAG: baseplate J/gp47 family protein, partial [Methylococcaceae bacterium]|nr:baseplate J/gp47 family protein [Methylococcaceae bacterium]
SALRYPEWQERSEADFGVMFRETLSSLGDDLSYLQDRIAVESTLDTATQRRSVVRHARLVDYEPRPATSARTLVQVDVAAGILSLDTGKFSLYAATPDGGRIAFEIGEGLLDPATGLPLEKKYQVNPLWNRTPGIPPYWWDDSQRCLKAGATRMWVKGHGLEFFDQQLLLLESEGATSADPKIRDMVRVKRLEGSVYETTDELFGDEKVTLLEWYADTALRHDHDLTQSRVLGNLVPATQGARLVEGFMIPPCGPNAACAIWRSGTSQPRSDGSPPRVADQYIYTLQQPALSWLSQDDPDLSPFPEIILNEVSPSGPGKVWVWRQQLLQASRFENAYTLDPARYVRINGSNETYAMYEYDGGDGYSIRFGGGDFGITPQPGTLFQTQYRTGDGSAGNVAADSITNVDPASSAVILAATNPFPATGGADAETDEQVRRRAPYAFRAKQYRAVRPEDYRKAAETLPWVTRAGATFRWTGSWLTGFVTADPKGSERITVDQEIQLIDLVNRYRLAGYEVYAPLPRYVGLDLEIKVCVLPDAYRGQVEAEILDALRSVKLTSGKSGFFYVDRFTFGTPLERSALEAAIQGCSGVRGVLRVRYRRRGLIPDYIDMPDRVEVGSNEIIRVDNDPNFPEKGSIKINLGGGK